MMSVCDHRQRYSQTAYHSHGFDGVGEDGGFRSGYYIEKRVSLSKIHQFIHVLM